jgi:hypothetical protein
MTDETSFTYTVRCRTCRTTFEVQLFESHQKNLFLVDKKDWYCENCKKDYFDRQAKAMTKDQGERGLPPLSGTRKMVSWALKIRLDMLKKVDYYRQTLRFDDPAAEARSNQGFSLLMDSWRSETGAKWWIDHRRMTVRDIVREMEALIAGEEEGGA